MASIHAQNRGNQCVCMFAKWIWGRWRCANSQSEADLQWCIFIRFYQWKQSTTKGDIRVRRQPAACWHAVTQRLGQSAPLNQALAPGSFAESAQLLFCWNTGWQVLLTSSPHDVCSALQRWYTMATDFISWLKQAVVGSWQLTRWSRQLKNDFQQGLSELKRLNVGFFFFFLD